MKVSSILYLTLTLLLWSCSSSSESNTKSGIVCTTGMVGDAVKNIVGDRQEVTVLMGPGVDPHLYKVVHSDLEKLNTAAQVFYNGLHLEGKMADVLSNIEDQYGIPGMAISEGLEESDLRSISGTTHDPHIWFDVSLWMKAVKYAGDQLSKNDPDHAELYQTNTTAYCQELKELHEWVKVQIASIPKERRVLITAHDAFGYFGQAYDIEVRGLQGVSTVSQAGIKDRKKLVDLIIERKIKAIFVETSISDRQLKAIIEDCAERGHTVTIGGTLYSDAMGAAGSEADNYIGMVKANVTTIVNALR